MRNLYKISIIIPIYNALRYIERCLESVETQTLSEMEVILVDDHGTDDSIALAKTFANQSKRRDIVYRFIETPQNSGPAKARNLGLKQATGEYVAFLDADDWIEPEMYETLYEKAKTANADLSCCNAMQDFEDGQKSRVLTNPIITSNPISIGDRKNFLKTYVAYFWTYIYRREWLVQNEIVFANSKSAEDSAFIGCCLLAAERFAQTENALYHYVIHAGSLTQRKVWKGAEKRKSFRAMMDFARTKGLWSPYRCELHWIYFKKAIITPILEYLR